MTEAILDRYDLTTEVDGHIYLTSWLPQIQKIIYTRTDGMDAGEFKVRAGFIVSKKPMAFLLEAEIATDIQLKKERLVQR